MELNQTLDRGQHTARCRTVVRSGSRSILSLEIIRTRGEHPPVQRRLCVTSPLSKLPRSLSHCRSRIRRFEVARKGARPMRTGRGATTLDKSRFTERKNGLRNDQVIEHAHVDQRECLL